MRFYQPTTVGLAPLKEALRAACVQISAARAHLLPEADVLEGLSEFCAQQDAQLLVLATAEGCLTRRFFHPHNTKTRAVSSAHPGAVVPTSSRPTEASCAACSRRKAAALEGDSASPASRPTS